MSQPLAGRKIGVLIESLYVPSEISAYLTELPAMGASVDLLTRLWGVTSAKFSSDPNGLDKDGKSNPVETIDVRIDFDHVKLEDYAAIIMCANYPSVRLRYYEAPQQPSDAPAVKFFARAMENPHIVKGALCHGLWILTPRPDLLHGRHVTCHEVVRADVINAGGVITASDTNVVVDRDLVTGHSKDEVHRFIQAIADQIVNMSKLHPN
jgi:protease I